MVYTYYISQTEREIMAYKNRVTIKDEKGYREEVWDFKDYEKMEDTLDDQLAEGIILDWWIEN